MEEKLTGPEVAMIGMVNKGLDSLWIAYIMKLPHDEVKQFLEWAFSCLRTEDIDLEKYY